MPQASDALDLEQVIRILRRRLPLIALCAIVVAAAAFVYSKHEKKTYSATAAVSFSSNPLSQQIAGLQSGSTNVLVQQASDLQRVRLGDMAAKTARIVGHGLTASQVSEKLSITSQGESNIVGISAEDSSPQIAAALATTYARTFVEEQQQSERRYFQSALALVDKQLAGMTPAQRIGEDGLALQEKAQTLKLLSGLRYGSVELAQSAVVPSGPTSPKTSRNTALGLLLGLVIGLCLAFVLEHLDRRVRGPRDLEDLYELPLLGSVPISRALAKESTGGIGPSLRLLPPTEAEAFSLIRAHLKLVAGARELNAVMVASAEQGEGKTTLATQLAATAARMGGHVLLIEADLRQPTLWKSLGALATPGMADVVSGAVALEQAVQPVDLGQSSGTKIGVGSMHVLVAGSAPQNPGALIEGRGTTDLLARARSAYDLVVIDTPPLTATSDAFPLLSQVDGVLIVGWVGRTSTDAAQRLSKAIEASGARLLGVVANGSKQGAAAAYPPSTPASPAAASATLAVSEPTTQH